METRICSATFDWEERERYCPTRVSGAALENPPALNFWAEKLVMFRRNPVRWYGIINISSQLYMEICSTQAG